jgi:hypothetical protein
LHSALKQSDKSLEMATKAESVLRPYCAASDPKDALKLLNYAIAYSMANPKSTHEEYEKCVRRVLELDP